VRAIKFDELREKADLRQRESPASTSAVRPAAIVTRPAEITASAPALASGSLAPGAFVVPSDAESGRAPQK
jgi:hypothetical protein